MTSMERLKNVESEISLLGTDSDRNSVSPEMRYGRRHRVSRFVNNLIFED